MASYICRASGGCGPHREVYHIFGSVSETGDIVTRSLEGVLEVLGVSGAWDGGV